MTFLNYSIQTIPFETLSRLILWICVTASDDTQLQQMHSWVHSRCFFLLIVEIDMVESIANQDTCIISSSEAVAESACRKAKIDPIREIVCFCNCWDVTLSIKESPKMNIAGVRGAELAWP
ncbi:hypothetical protein LWI28_012271 [Acer negundo]|uniref:Uncharacterized protein n=1 Tax=Acer negundo TaxID=4023 RepID=A0AAD5I5V4_ACENE|nr:hypothetical protein LWI28_012271 [Acer negundo]